jgi:predicted GNAT family acetyltransferase
MRKYDLKKIIQEVWSKKYKKSIDCSNPKGFSQKAHCDARKKRQRGAKTKSKSVTENYVLKSLENNYPIELQLFDKGTHLELDKILVPSGMRGVGIGSEVMSKIAEYSDKIGKPVFLTPSTSYGGTSLERLKRFYRRFGFSKVKEMGDKALSRNMFVRHPK